MKIIEQNGIIWGETPYTKDDAVLWIERAGRVCYRSDDKIVPGSGIKFVGNIIKRKHYSVIEHSNLVVRTIEKSKFPFSTMMSLKKYFDSPFLKFAIENDYVYVAGNWRAWIEWAGENEFEASFEDFPECLFENDSLMEIVTDKNDIPNLLRAITVEFVTDRAVTHELVRHRPVSYSQESQRYVKYGSIIFIKPYWFDSASAYNQHLFEECCLDAEEGYCLLLDNGLKAEEARVVLPNATATRIVVTTYIPEWEHVFNLRTSKRAYPQIRKLLTPVRDEFILRGWI